MQRGRKDHGVGPVASLRDPEADPNPGLVPGVRPEISPGPGLKTGKEVRVEVAATRTKCADSFLNCSSCELLDKHYIYPIYPLNYRRLSYT